MASHSKNVLVFYLFICSFFRPDQEKVVKAHVSYKTNVRRRNKNLNLKKKPVHTYFAEDGSPLTAKPSKTLNKVRNFLTRTLNNQRDIEETSSSIENLDELQKSFGITPDSEIPEPDSTSAIEQCSMNDIEAAPVSPDRPPLPDLPMGGDVLESPDRDPEESLDFTIEETEAIKLAVAAGGEMESNDEIDCVELDDDDYFPSCKKPFCYKKKLLNAEYEGAMSQVLKCPRCRYVN